MQLAHADKSKQRFYSMSAQIQANRDKYYDILENYKDVRYYNLAEMVSELLVAIDGAD
jgi:Fic family protein